MPRRYFPLGVALALLALIRGGKSTSLAAQDSSVAAHPPAAVRADVVTPDALLGALYDVISGPAGQPRDWDRFRSLFAPGARLVPTRHAPDGRGALRVLDVEGYVTAARSYFDTTGFYEREVARRLERFGSIAHAWSTYESRHAAADPRPFARGINSIQLHFDGTRWWVVTIYWDAERPDTPIPARYLRSGR